jgi:hypothetical protein
MRTVVERFNQKALNGTAAIGEGMPTPEMSLARRRFPSETLAEPA